MALGYRKAQRQSSSFDRHSPEKDLSFPRTGLLRKKGLRIIRRIFRIHPGAFSDPLSHAIIANQLPSTVRFTAVFSISVISSTHLFLPFRCFTPLPPPLAYPTVSV